MRYLYLMRHASTEESAPGGDAARQLTATGKRDAQRAGEQLALWSPVPQRVLCSSATRVQQTVAQLRLGAGAALAGAAVETDAALYLASERRIMDLIAGVADGTTGLLVVAHNPGLSDLAQTLIGSAADETIGCLGLGFRPATMMGLSFAVTRWADLAPGTGRLEHCAHA